MIIDEDKLKKTAESRMNSAKGAIPALKFHRGKNARANRLEKVRIIIGILVAVSMVFGSAALVWTLLSEGQRGVDTAIRNSNMRAPNASDVQVIILPKSEK